MTVGAGQASAATLPSLVTRAVDTAQVTPLAQHHPNWAIAANRIAAVNDDQDFEQMTLVLTRPASQQAAFEQFLDEVQNPSSPSYHKWLTPSEVGHRFGLSDGDLAAISGWLNGQGLHVNLVTPNRTSIQFGGSALNIGRAFQTSLSTYSVDGEQRLSVDSEPTIPLALAPVIRAVRGLYSVNERPQHTTSTLPATSPEYTYSSGSHYLTPADFATIYDVPTTYTGAGVTIGIVSWSRVSTADLDAFRAKTGASFQNPTVVIPTAYGGLDPGAALTAPPTGSVSLGGQEEATLDVIRVGSTAPGANLLLVAAQNTTASHDGIGADTQYLVGTYPVPAQVITISFGGCESQATSSDVAFWDNLFSSAAAEGISVFVSSGDSAAAGCDNAFSTLPGAIVANSPNYTCSSQYATCVGGTEFVDTASPSTYWSSSNSATNGSALQYIPEGGWNESSTSNSIGIGGSGGGVSLIVATPSWQTATGVPSARAGRYTPDVSFSAAEHDGYFACMAADNRSCTGTNWQFLSFSGTSAAAPGMAGVAALLDQKLGGGQGNLNPRLYSLYATTPSAFHDVTVASSGVGVCNVNTVSLCNNSIYYTTTGAVQPGFVVGTGYDEVTGLGSLNVANFLSTFAALPTPTVTLVPGANPITTAQALSVTVTVAGSKGTPTGTVIVTNGTYTSASTLLVAASATVVIPAGSLTGGTALLTATYTPDSGSSFIYGMATSTPAVSVTVNKATPTVTVTPGANPVNTNQSLSVTVGVSAGASTVTATGSVTLYDGSTSVGSGTLTSGSATITVAAGALPGGTASLTATYTPDTAGATLYNSSTSAAASVTVNTVAPTVTVIPTASTITVFQAPTGNLTVYGGAGAATGTVMLTISNGSNTMSAGPLPLSNGAASYNFSAGSFWVGSNSLTATYTPDTTGATLYTTAASTAVTVTVNKATPTVTVTSAYSSIAPGQVLAVSAVVSGGTGSTTPRGTVTLTSGAYTSAAATLSSGAATINIPASTFAVGSQLLTVNYIPDSFSSGSYNSNSGTGNVSVARVTPTVSASALPSSITTLQSTTLSVTVAGNAGNPTPTGSVVLTNGSYTSAATTLASGAASIVIPAGTLAAGTDTVTATYTPDGAATGSASFIANTGTTSVLIGTAAPAVTVAATPASFTTVQGTSVAVTVSGGTGNPTATGSVVLSSGSYTSATTTLTAGTASIVLPAGSLAAGTPTLTASYTPDPAGANTYKATTGTTTVNISKVAPTVLASASPSSITTLQGTSVTVAVSGGTGNPAASGTVTLNSGSYTSAANSIVGGAASINIPTSTLAAGSPAVTATYNPDATASATYSTATGSTNVTVTRVAPNVSVSPVSSSIAITLPLSVVVTVTSTGSTPSGTVILSSGSYSSAATKLVSGSANILVPANTFAAGGVSFTAAYTPDTNGALLYASNTGSGSVTYTPAPTFTLSGTTVTVSRGSAAPSTITVTPLYGFTGPVTLTATVTTKPSSSQYAPALSFGTSPVTVSGASAVPSTLTVSAANTTATAPFQPLPLGGWRTTGFAALASIILFLAPTRLRKWRALLGMMALSIAVVSGLIACGGSPSISGTPSKLTPAVTVSPASSSITNLQTLVVTVTVTGSTTPTGAVTLYSGSTALGTATLSNGSASFTLAAGALSIGSDTLTSTYTPDASSSATYNSVSASAANPVTVEGASTAGSYVVTVTGTSGGTTATTTVNVTVQ